MSILITGAGGNVGTETIKALLRLRPDSTEVTRIVAGVRDPDKSSQSFPTQPDRFVRLDFTDATTFAPALIGIDRLLLVRPPELADVERYFRPFVEALQHAHVKQVVFLSLEGVDNNSITPHYKIEKLIRDAGLSYTMLRPGFFMQNLSTTHRKEIRDRNEIFIPAGQGRTNFVDVQDIGEVAALALLNPDQHHNQAYTLTGPAALTYTDVAEILTDVLGRKITYRNPSLLAFIWRRWRVEHENFSYVLVMSALYTVARLGKAATLTTDLVRLLGHPARSFREFATDVKAVWQS